MNNKINNHNKILLKKIIENPEWKNQKKVFNQMLQNPKWYTSIEKNRKTTCYKNILKAFKKAKQTKDVERFIFCHKSVNFAFPLVADGKIAGFIGAGNIKTDLPNLENIISLLSASIKVTTNCANNALKLEELCETIRPRAIALSTAHTVHRIISSTLELNELLPKIARLSLQVLRAKHCSIMLLDDSKKILIPKASISLKNRSIGTFNLTLGKKIPGKVAKSGSFHISPKCLSVPLLDEDVIGVITVWEKEDRASFSSSDQEILTTLSEQAAIAIKNAQLYEEQQKLTMGSIKSLATMLDLKDPHRYTASPAFITITTAIGKKLGLSEERLNSLHYAAMIHDAGKISISEDILGKASQLTEEEYKAIREHPFKGATVIRSIDILKPIAPIILYHHEKFDGTGYPAQLKGDQIPLGSRILAITEAFMAMITKRPYRSPKSIPEAIVEIKINSGTQFDPKVVKAFLKVIQEKGIKGLLKKEGAGKWN